MKNFVKKSLALFLVAIMCFAQTAVFAAATEEVVLLNAMNVMKKQVHIASDGTELPYRLYVPDDYNPEKQYSFLLFLHGAGNRGNDNENQVKQHTGLLDRIINGETVEYNGQQLDTSKEFIMVVPQCASDKQWVDTPWGKKPDPSYNLDEIPQSQYMTAVVELIDKMKASYNLNSARMYISGLSMGGFGTWDLITRYPDLFAAAIPMGGAGDVSKAEIIKNTPVWTFHQLYDPTVSAEGTLEMVKALSEVGAEVKFTPYFDDKHNAWTQGFAEPDMLQWLYDHVKGKAKLAFVGDSITYGVGVSDRFSASLVALVKDALEDNYIVENFGVSGSSSLYSAKTPWINTPEAKLAYEFKPDVLHIMLGTNDIKNENWDAGKNNFKDDYKKIVDGFKALNPNLKVYVGIPPRIHKENVFGTRSPKILEEEGIPRIYEIAAEIGAETINYFDPTKDKPECFADFLHPNEEGYKIFAAEALKVIPEKFEFPKETAGISLTQGASEWAKGEIALATASGIMPLKLRDNFQADITREEFCEMVINMLPKDLDGYRKASFKDTKNEAVEYAYAIGVVNGVSDKMFEPELNATRQEMAAMLYRAYKLIAPNAVPTTYTTAPDSSSISAWASESVDFMNEQKIMNGDDLGNLNPLSNTTREEAVLMVYRSFCSANRYGK